MPEHLLLQLEAPLMAFGGEIIDHRGVTRDFPGQAALTGLLANALGWDRADGARHDRLQARLRAGALRMREGSVLRDFQTAFLNKRGTDSFGWTTHGLREGRDGGDGTYQSPHIRQRDWHADLLVLVALRLDPAEEHPNLGDLAEALKRPARPLFLGRKPGLPSVPLLFGQCSADTISVALQQGAERLVAAKRPELSVSPWRGEWPAGEGAGVREFAICDERRWQVGVHGGLRQVVSGQVAVPEAGE